MALPSLVDKVVERTLARRRREGFAPVDEDRENDAALRARDPLNFRALQPPPPAAPQPPIPMPGPTIPFTTPERSPQYTFDQILGRFVPKDLVTNPIAAAPSVQQYYPQPAAPMDSPLAALRNVRDTARAVNAAIGRVGFSPFTGYKGTYYEQPEVQALYRQQTIDRLTAAGVPPDIAAAIAETSAPNVYGEGHLLGGNAGWQRALRAVGEEALQPTSLAAMAVPVLRGETLAATVLKNAAAQGGTNVALDLLLGRTDPRELALSAALGATLGGITSPGLVSALRARARTAGMTLDEYASTPQARRLIESLQSERGSLRLPEPERKARIKELRGLIDQAEQEFDNAVGLEKRQMLSQRIDELRSELSMHENAPPPGQIDMLTGDVVEEAPTAPREIVEQPELTEPPLPETPSMPAEGAPAPSDLPRFAIVPTSRIKVRPDLFQARASFNQKAVDRIVRDFDPDKLDDLWLVPDPDAPGDYIVLGGHHRKAALEKLGRDAPSKIYDLDIRDPVQLQKAQELADFTNASQQPLTLKSRINIVTRAGTDDVTEIRSKYPAFNNDQQVKDAIYIRELGPNVIDKLEQLPDNSPLIPIAAEIGYGRKAYGFSQDDAEGLFSRLTRGAKTKLPARSYVREAIDKAGARLQAKQQGDLFAGMDQASFVARNELLDAIDADTRLSAEIHNGINDLARKVKHALELGFDEDAPPIVAARKKLSDLEARKVQLETDYFGALRAEERPSAIPSSTADALGSEATSSAEIPPSAGTQKPREIPSTRTEPESSSTTRTSEPSESLEGPATTRAITEPSVPPGDAEVLAALSTGRPYDLSGFGDERLVTLYNSTANPHASALLADALRERGIDPLSTLPDVTVGNLRGRTLGASRAAPGEASAPRETPAARLRSLIEGPDAIIDPKSPEGLRISEEIERLEGRRPEQPFRGQGRLDEAPVTAPKPTQGGLKDPDAVDGAPDPVDLVLRAETTEDLERASFLREYVGRVRSIRTFFGKDARTARAADRDVLDKAKNIVVRYEGRLSMAAEEAGHEVRNLRAGTPKLSRDELRSIYGALDNVDDATRTRFLDNLSPPARKQYDELRKRIDAMGDLLEARGIISAESRRKGYVPHMIDFADEGAQFRGSRPLHTPRPKDRRAIITGHRTRETIAESIAAGDRPLTLDPFKVYEQFVAEATQRMAMADVISDIRTFDPEGVKFLKPGERPPRGFSEINHPMFQGLVGADDKIIRYKWVVRDNVAQYVKSLAEPSAVRQSRIGRGALKAVASAKRTALGGPLDINFAGFEAKAASYTVGSDVRKIIWPAIKTGLKGQAEYDRFLDQEVDYFGMKLTRLQLYKRLTEAGLTSGSYRTEISRMLGEDTPSTVIGLIPGVGKWYDKAQNAMEAAQFDRAIPILKRESAAILVARKMEGKPFSMRALEAAEREAASDVNTAMGGLNRVMQGRSKTMQDIAALTLIAPDWMESRLRLFGKALIPGASNATARRFMARVMVVGAVSAIMGRAIYAKSQGMSNAEAAKYIADGINPLRYDGEDTRINPRFMQFQLPNGQWAGLTTWEMDGWRLMFGGYSYARGDTDAGNQLAGRYFSARLGIAPRAIKDALVNRDFRERPIRRDKGWKGIAQYLGYEASQTGIPSFAREFGNITELQPGGGGQTPYGAAFNVTGLGRIQQLRPYDVANQRLRALGVAEGLKADKQAIFEASKKDPKLAQALRDLREDRIQRGDDFARAQKDIINLQSKSDSQLAAGDITGSEWREAYQRNNSLLSFAASQQEFGRSDDPVLADYYAIFDNPEYVDQNTGQIINTDIWDEVDAYVASLSPEDQEKIDRNVGWGETTDTVRDYRETVRDLRDAGWFDADEKVVSTLGLDDAGFKDTKAIKDKVVEAVMGIVGDNLTADQRVLIRQLVINKVDNAPGLRKIDEAVAAIKTSILLQNPGLGTRAVRYGFTTSKTNIAAALLK